MSAAESSDGQAYVDTFGKAPYPSIDIDPHFNRVVQNFRPSDYMRWASGVAFFPSMLYMLEKADPSGRKGTYLRQGPAMRLGAFLGVCGGFLWAYQTSSFRLWGWAENGIEVARAKEQGKSAPGLDTSQSELSPYMQGAAFRNSQYAALKFVAFPWFNFVNHGHHGPGVLGESGGDDAANDSEE